jgi:hypothetical protein
MFKIIVKAFENQENLEFNNEEFIIYDKFIDEQIKNGNIIKHSQYNFTGKLFADKINFYTKNTIIYSLNCDDQRIDYKVKGQGLYFLVNNKIAIMTFSENALTFFPMK